MAFDFIQADLEQRRRSYLLRQHQVVDVNYDGLITVADQAYLNFASNDYLGLRQQPEVLQAWVEGLELYGAGSGASPLVTGYSRAHQQLAEALAEFTGREACLLFNSGYAANHAICHALFKQPGTLIADKLSHASLIEAGRTSGCQFKRFKHNDLQHLQSIVSNQLSADSENVLIATEGVFSMDGNSAPISELANLSQQCNAWLMIDDAHGFGVLGELGQGIGASSTNQNQCQVLMATMGKACGIAGAFVAGTQSFIDYLTNFARHYIYSTAIPPAQAHATLASLALIQQGDLRQKLRANIAYFKTKMAALDFALMPSDSAIQPIMVGDPAATIAYAEQLKSLGVWVGAMRYPTVPKGSDRLRITLSSLHSEQDIDALCDALEIARDKR